MPTYTTSGLSGCTAMAPIDSVLPLSNTGSNVDAAVRGFVETRRGGADVQDVGLAGDARDVGDAAGEHGRPDEPPRQAVQQRERRMVRWRAADGRQSSQSASEQERNGSEGCGRSHALHFTRRVWRLWAYNRFRLAGAPRA